MDTILSLPTTYVNGCSAGYCLNSYTQMAIKEINSQVNEQANAGLQRIRGQLAYMTPENFVYSNTLFNN